MKLKDILLELVDTNTTKSEYKIKRSELDGGQWAYFTTMDGVRYYKKVKLYGLYIWRQDGRYNPKDVLLTAKKERPLTADEESKNAVWRVYEFYD